MTGRSVYRVRRIPDRVALSVHHVCADGRERPLVSANVADPSEASGAAALAVLGDLLRGDFPRAQRLVDSFQHEWLFRLNVLDELELEVMAIAAWVRVRERR